MLAINQVLQGRYRISRLLGQGGMGAVYEAIDERFGEPIALKEIIVDLTNSKQKELVIGAFEREAKALAKAKHEAVPYVRDYFFELDRQFLVMELVEGEDLGEMLEKRGQPFLLEDVLQWIYQLLDALDYLHNLKPPIIHRDIKPQNLKLNVRRRLKLLDFGIARSSDKTGTLTNQTFIGATLNYSPIEQILRVIDPTFREFIILKHQEKAEAVLSQDTDARCDIYALGGTFYHLLTNRVPVDATKRTLDLWEGKPDALPNPSHINPHIPPMVSACLMKALAVERDQRFGSALEMQEALKVAVADAQRVGSEPKSRETIVQRETLKLITKDDLKIENPTERISSFPGAAASPIQKPVINLPPPPKNSGFVPVSNTRPSGNISGAELTSGSYLAGILPDEPKTSPETVPFVQNPGKNESNVKPQTFRALPIVLGGVLAVAGIGGLIGLGAFLIGSPVSNKPVTNVVISQPTATPTVEPTTTPTATPDVSPTTSPTQNDAGARKDNPKSATPNKTPVQDPVKTPPTQKKTPAKTTPDPNCIFTNSCK